MKITLFGFIILVLTLISCQNDPSSIQSGIVLTLTHIPSLTPYPTYTPLPPLSTLTPYPTPTQAPTQTAVVVIVTPTLSPTPMNTATFTPTATRTATPFPTLNFLQLAKGAGNYLVNVDIAPGVWRNNGTNDNCYWKRATRSGNTIDEYHGKGGGTITIAASDYRVDLDWNCGVWNFLGGS